ncbi:MAG: hypothetical protein IPL65_02675 [Lewinellaceae bacterium]|nr:hypothetical protein [Lewinellaceae bacterium]
MFSDKLLTLLGSFSKYELNRFRKFLVSPYYNEQEVLINLFDLCNLAIREGTVEKLDKNTVWKHLFPGKKLNDAQLRRTASELNQLALKFYSLEYREQQPMLELLDLQRKLESPVLFKHLSSVERLVDKYFEQAKPDNAKRYLEKHLYRWNIFDRASRTVSSSDYIDKLLPADFNLELFYIVQKLKLYVAWLSFRNFRNTSAVIDVVPGFWEYISQSRFQRIPLIGIYGKVVLCLSEPEDESHFEVLMLELDDKGVKLDDEDLRECYHIAQNYCALKINQGKVHYYRAIFQIYQRMISRSMLLEDDRLAEGVYKNIITTSLQVGEYAWAEEFIQNYSDYLPANIRENAHSYNLASLYFHQKKYDKVIDLLRSVEYSDVTYALGGKLLLLRTYHEKGEVFALESLIDSVRIYLRRNKFISKTMVREFGNFLTFLKKLNDLAQKSPAEIQKFKARVQDNPAVISKKWLLQKIDEI